MNVYLVLPLLTTWTPRQIPLNPLMSWSLYGRCNTCDYTCAYTAVTSRATWPFPNKDVGRLGFRA